ncbi:MAG: thioredoxin fold domain-containing protein [Proteobacteria bacterium]|nr:thioredoxin fold domain-containing protein [Pseudomonadota bacterium]
MRLSRRAFSRLAVGGLLGVWAPVPKAVSAPDKYAPIPKQDSSFGSFTQSWFLDSFLDFADDLAEAAAKGKRLALLWELDGCPYCREMHLVNFAMPRIRDYVEANFEIVQLDLRGQRQTVDFDGKAMTERKLASRNAVRFTPTLQFFPETVAETAGRTGKKAEVARMAGYFRPHHFLAMFRYVREKRYTDGDFRTYLKTRPGN